MTKNFSYRHLIGLSEEELREELSEITENSLCSNLIRHFNFYKDLKFYGIEKAMEDEEYQVLTKVANTLSTNFCDESDYLGQQLIDKLKYFSNQFEKRRDCATESPDF